MPIRKPNFAPPFNIVRASHVEFGVRDLAKLARLLCRLPRLSGHRRGQERDLSARGGGAQSSLDRAAQVERRHGPGAGLQGRERGGSRSRGLLVRAQGLSDLVPRNCRIRAVRCAPATCSACRSTSISGWTRPTACCANMPNTKARASSASTTSTASRRTCRPPTISIPSSASGSPNTPKPTDDNRSSGRCGCIARAMCMTLPSPTARGPRLHHIGVWTASSLDILHICDVMASSGFLANMERGPGRHGISNAFFLYIRDPDGHRVELFTSDYLTVDPDFEPLRWALQDAAAPDAVGSPGAEVLVRGRLDLHRRAGARAGAGSTADRGALTRGPAFRRSFDRHAALPVPLAGEILHASSLQSVELVGHLKAMAPSITPPSDTRRNGRVPASRHTNCARPYRKAGHRSDPCQLHAGRPHPFDHGQCLRDSRHARLIGQYRPGASRMSAVTIPVCLSRNQGEPTLAWRQHPSIGVVLRPEHSTPVRASLQTADGGTMRPS